MNTDNIARKPAYYLAELMKKNYHLISEEQRRKLEAAYIVLEELEQRLDRRLP